MKHEHRYICPGCLKKFNSYIALLLHFICCRRVEEQEDRESRMFK